MKVKDNTILQYIEMCRTRDIQDLHQPAIGDRYVCACDSCKSIQRIYYINDYDVDYINKRDLTNVYRPYAQMIKDSSTCYFGAYYDMRDKEHMSYIWLPRQEDLQEMVDCARAFLIKHFSEFCEIEAFRVVNEDFWFKSMEQLWLAFVMKERFEKVWNGKEWIEDERKNS